MLCFLFVGDQTVNNQDRGMLEGVDLRVANEHTDAQTALQERLLYITHREVELADGSGTTTAVDAHVSAVSRHRYVK